MPLSAEDTLRLNVLLANAPQAIRINESKMMVSALSEKGEAQITLNPNCRDDQYIKQVKEMISGHVLGSPGGYPVYLQRWTRMGQMRDESLEQLLLLGEQEAVVAAVCAPGLTNELARRAWWAMEDAENARQMLTKDLVINGDMGPVLAEYLLEFLPFETDAAKMIESVRLILQGELLDREAKEALWKKAQRKSAFYVGFLASVPDELPHDVEAHPLLPQYEKDLQGLAGGGNPVAVALHKTLSAPGQAYLETVKFIFKKPANQDVVTTTLETIADYFSGIREGGKVDMEWDDLSREAEDWLAIDSEAQAVIELDESMHEFIHAMRVLSGLSYGIVRPVFRDSTAIGSLMRRKIEPVITPLMELMSSLRA